LQYKDEGDLELVMSLIDNELSEPYSIFTYRYFLRNWPNLCFMSFDPAGRCFGCVVAKMDVHRERALRGYIAMLVVEKQYRHLGIGERRPACRRPALPPARPPAAADVPPAAGCRQPAGAEGDRRDDCGRV
jgi:GNAT superfamily N-acetyltransferase